jgi:hypothetical protein
VDVADHPPHPRSYDASNSVDTSHTIGSASTSAQKRSINAVVSVESEEDEDFDNHPKPCTFFFSFTSQ